MRYYIQAFKNYTKSDGRATRKEYWWFILFHYLFMFVFAIIDAMFDFYPQIATDYYVHSFDYGYLTLIYLIATLCPSICLQVRRLHDVGKSGSWWWLKNIPIISCYVLYLNCKASEPTINAYGYPSNYKPNSIQINAQESQKDDCFTVCVYDDTDKTIRKIKKVIDVNKIPPAKYANNGTYYAIDKINDDKKLRTYCTKENWENQIETPLTDRDCKTKYCRKCGCALMEDSKFCHKCGNEVIHEKYEVCIFDAENKNLRKETREIDAVKFPVSKYAFNDTYYAIEKIRDGKKVRIYYEKNDWDKQIENSL